jgi:hypothetical protein
MNFSVSVLNFPNNRNYLQRLTFLGEQSDVVHVTLKDQWVVKGRDMVTARVWRKLGDSMMISGRHIDCHLMPPQKNKIRYGTNAVLNWRKLFQPPDLLQMPSNLLSPEEINLLPPNC